AVSFGLQAGAKISNLAISVTESISLTDNEADAISDATDVLTESWILVDKKLKETSGRWEANVATRNKKGELIKTGVQVQSGTTKDENGADVPSGIWESEAYVEG